MIVDNAKPQVAQMSLWGEGRAYDLASSGRAAQRQGSCEPGWARCSHDADRGLDAWAGGPRFDALSKKIAAKTATGPERTEYAKLLPAHKSGIVADAYATVVGKKRAPSIRSSTSRAKKMLLEKLHAELNRQGLSVDAFAPEVKLVSAMHWTNAQYKTMGRALRSGL